MASGAGAIGAAALLLVIAPLGAVALHAGGLSLSAADLAALRFTLLQSALSALLSVALAVPVARALARRRFPGRGLLITLMGAPFLLPVIVAILGLLAVFGRGGLLNDLLAAAGLGRVSVYGLQGVLLAHVFLNLPLATRMILQGWQSIPAERFRLAESLSFAPRDIARHIERPMLAAVLPGALATVFAICLTSFAVALTLGGGPAATTLELAIYQAVRFEFDLGHAAGLALVQAGLGGAAALAAWGLARGTGFGAGMDRALPLRPPGGGHRLADAAVLVLTAGFLLLPLVALVLRGVPGLSDLPASVWPAAARSIAVALISTAVVVPAALALALAAAKGAGRWIELAAVLPLALSGLVLGTGLFLLVQPVLPPTRLALPVTVLVNALMTLPFAFRLILPEARVLVADYGRLAAAMDLRGWPALRYLVLPRLARPLGFSAGVASALSMGDLGVIALFADRQEATLPLMVQHLTAAYRTQAAAGAGLVLVTLSFALFWAFDAGDAVLQLDRLVLEQDDFRLTADWTVPKGLRVALIGPSGAGKSTLLSAIAGFFPATRGRVLWDGQDLAALPPGQRPLSVLFQDQNLFPHLTLAQNLGLGLRPDLRLSAAEKTRVEEALDRVDLPGMGSRKPAQLSGGQVSRAALARVLLRARPLLLLDEPFAALGPALKDEMLALLAEVAAETAATVLMVTHAPGDARAFAQQTVLVADGRAAPPVPTLRLLADPPPALRAYLGEGPG